MKDCPVEKSIQVLYNLHNRTTYITTVLYLRTFFLMFIILGTFVLLRKIPRKELGLFLKEAWIQLRILTRYSFESLILIRGSPVKYWLLWSKAMGQWYLVIIFASLFIMTGIMSNKSAHTGQLQSLAKSWQPQSFPQTLIRKKSCPEQFENFSSNLADYFVETRIQEK